VMEKMDIIQNIESIVKSMRFIADVEGINVNFVQPAMESLFIVTDRVKFQQVLDNLLQNACKFTPKGGKIDVSVKADTKKKRVLVSVKDNGVGIPKKDLKIIFDKFQQGSRYSQGVGIGLYLCKSYMDMLNGSVSVTSKPGKGSCFTLSLPL